MKYSLLSLVRNSLSYHENWQEAWSSPELKKEYDIIIVGGGGHGLGTAYYLAKEFGLKNIAVLEKGWIGSRKSISAAYLTGYLAGKKALCKGAKDAILYTGTKRYTQRMAAALKGVIDAGLEVPADSETFPADERINGEHLTVKNEISKIKSTIDSEVKQI